MSNRKVGDVLKEIEKFEENEQYEKAVENLLVLNENIPNNSEIIKNLAMDYQVLQNEDEAIKWWEAYKKLEPNETIGYSQLCDLYIHRDRYNYYMNRAQIKVIEQKLSQAADDYKKAITSAENEDDSSKARFMLAVMYEALKKNTDAIQEYLRLIEHEENANIYYRLAELYKLESAEDAISLLETAIEKFPQENGFKEMAAKLYYQTGDLENALKYAQDDLTRAKIYLEKQENDRAKEILDTVKMTADNAVHLHSLKAEYNYNLENYEEALKNLDDLEKVAPNLPLLFQMRAMVYESMNNDSASRLSWAKCYELKGQTELAIDELLLVLHSDPENEQAIMSIINIYNRLGDNNSVVEFCERLYRLDENNSFALKKLAEFYESHGEYNMAVDFYEKLYVQDKSNMSNLKLLAGAYEKIKDIESAKKAWQKYIERAPIGDETEKIKAKLQSMENTEGSYTSSEGFLDKLLGFFSRK